MHLFPFTMDGLNKLTGYTEDLYSINISISDMESLGCRVWVDDKILFFKILNANINNGNIQMNNAVTIV